MAKHILELCLAHGLGGLEMFSASCYTYFSKNTQCSIVVAPHQKLDRFIESEHKFLLKRNKFLPFIPAYKLAKYIDTHKVDIVHFHWTRDMMTAVLAKLLSKRKPKLIQSRHMGMTRFKSDSYHRFLYKNIDMIHAVTHKVKEQLERFIPQDIRPQIEMLYLGVELKDIESSKLKALEKQYNKEDSFVLGIVGRIEEGKGQYKVIEALALLDNTSIQLLIVGEAMEASYLQGLRKRVEELGLEEQVVFTGFSKEVDVYMKIFDLAVLATENETFGLVVIEAMAQKTPVLATNKGGPLEIIEDGIDGLLFDGSIEDLSKKIQILYKNHSRTATLSQNAYIKVKNLFCMHTQLGKLYAIM